MKLYTKKQCPACEKVKSFMAENKITNIQIVDATNDMVSRMKMSEAGVMTFPCLEKDNGEFLAPSDAIIDFLQPASSSPVPMYVVEAAPIAATEVVPGNIVQAASSPKLYKEPPVECEACQ